jgi:tetratricopeptide (TPR) repeat protein
MKNLKNILVALVFLLSLTLQAQNKEIALAFSSSYELEYAKKYDAAIAAFNNVYVATSYEMNLRLGWLHYLSGKNKESISYYQKAAIDMPAATEPKWAIITVYTKMANWTEIEKTYLSILKIDPKNATANYNLALIYYYRKNYVVAKKYFDVSLNLTPFGYNNMLMSAWTNYFLGNKNNASILFNKVLLFSPNDASALEGLGLIK